MFKDRYGFPLARKQLTVEYGREVAAFLGGLKDAPATGAQPMTINVKTVKVLEDSQETVAYGDNEVIVLPNCAGIDYPCTIKVLAVRRLRDKKEETAKVGGRDLPVFKAEQWERI